MPLTVSECGKILGAFVDNDLFFKTRIFAMVKKAKLTRYIINSF